MYSHIIGYIQFLILCLLFPFTLSAQETSSPIKFSGSSRIYSQYSNRKGTNQQVPANYWRWDLNSTFSVYGLPISMKLFLSSEQSKRRQNVNAVHIYFNPQEFLKQEVKSKIARILSWFSKLGIGTSYPRYSPLSLNGVAVTGVNVEFSPGIVYLAVAAGRTHKAISGSNAMKSTYARNLLATRLGLGKKRSTHLHFTFIHAWDKEKSLANDTTGVAPQENFLVGTDMNLFLFKHRFNLQGELVASMLTRDVNSAEIEKKDLEKVPSWLVDFVEPKISSSLDYAYFVKSSLHLSNTQLSGAVKMIGPGFYSLGVPYLRNDELTYEARIKQSLWKRNVAVGSYFRRSRDNLIPWKRTTTISSAYGINLSLRFRKLPYLQLNYAPYFQNNDIDIENLKIDNKTSLFSAATGYNHRFGDMNSSTNFFFSTQNCRTKSGVSDYSTQTYSFNESLNFRFPLTLAGSVSLSNADYSRETSRIISFDFNGSYRAFKKWRNRIGLRLSKQEGNNNKTGFYLTSSIPVWKMGDLNLQAEQNFFRDNVESVKDYDEFVLRVTFSKTW